MDLGLSDCMSEPRQRDRGFTLIELIVVMVVMGIIAAIAIPTYQKQQRQAADVSVKNDVRAIGQAITSYWVDHPPNTAPTLQWTSGAVKIIDTTVTPNQAIATVQISPIQRSTAITRRSKTLRVRTTGVWPSTICVEKSAFSPMRSMVGQRSFTQGLIASHQLSIRPRSLRDHRARSPYI